MRIQNRVMRDAAALRVSAHALLVEAAERGDGAAACHLGDWFEVALEQAHPHAEEWVARLRARGISAAGLKEAEPSPPRYANPRFWDVTEDVMRHGIAILIGGRRLAGNAPAESNRLSE